MVREFSEEKRQEIFRMLDEIDNKEWKSFMEWCGSSAEEFGDWPDKLAVSAYTRYVDKYHERVLEINEMTRNRVNTVFENVAEIDTRYAGRMRECQEKIKQQIAMVNTMTEFMQSMTDGNPDMALITKGSVSGSGDSLKVKNKNKLEAEINYVNTATEEDSNENSIDIDCYEIRNSLSLGKCGIEDCRDTIKELYDNGFISEEDYDSICDLLEVVNDSSIDKLNRKEARKKLQEYLNHVVTTVYIYNCLQVLAGRTFSPKECCEANEIFRYFGIIDCHSIACFLLCCAVESGGFTSIKENYEANDIYSEDESGRGYLQITSEENQKACLDYIHDIYLQGELIENQGEYSGDLIDYPWTASAWFWTKYVTTGDKNINRYVVARCKDNRGKLTIGIVLVSECFVHGDVKGGISPILGEIARDDSLRSNNEGSDEGWYISGQDTKCVLNIPAGLLEEIKNRMEDKGIEIPSAWGDSEYLEYKAPHNWEDFPAYYDELQNNQLLDFDLKT